MPKRSIKVPTANKDVDRLVQARVPSHLMADVKSSAVSGGLYERELIILAVDRLLSIRSSKIRPMLRAYEDVLKIPPADTDQLLQFWIEPTAKRRLKSLANRLDLKLRQVVLLAVVGYLYGGFDVNGT